jgi:hypothetical protein
MTLNCAYLIAVRVRGPLQMSFCVVFRAFYVFFCRFFANLRDFRKFSANLSVFLLIRIIIERVGASPIFQRKGGSLILTQHPLCACACSLFRLTFEKELIVTTPGFFCQSSTAALMMRLAQVNPVRTTPTQKSFSRNLGALIQ